MAKAKAKTHKIDVADLEAKVNPDSEDVINIISRIHKHPNTDPQCAKIFPESRKLEYTIKPGAINLSFDYKDYAAHRSGFAAGLRILLPKEFDIEVLDKSIVNIQANIRTEVRNLEEEWYKLRNSAKYESIDFDILISYIAKDQKEFDRIRDYLEKTPEDSRMPKKGQTFFCYD